MTRKTSKIFLIIFASFFVTYLANKTIFLVNTPEINPKIASIFSDKTTEDNEKINSQVSAKEEVKTYILEDTNNPNYIIYVYTIDGKEIRIKASKGKKPLTEDQVKNIYFPDK